MSDKINNSYKRDFIELVCSSKRKIIKMIAVLFIPFVYAFICIAALWNPLGSIGKLPVAIVSLDKGAAQENPDTPPFLLDTFMDSWRSNGTLLTDLGLSYDVKTNKYCAKATDQFTFTNIDYISSTYEYANDNDPSKFASYDDTQEAQIDRWSIKGSKYYAEICFPPQFSEAIKSVDPNSLQNSICNYIAYEKNYVTCEILDMGSEFITGVIIQKIYEEILSEPLEPIMDFDNWILHDVPNKKFALYGVGIGELFLCVGMWVGAFAMVLSLDRKRRVARLSNNKWYFSKWLFMATISLAQSIVVMFAVGCLGLFGLGGGFILDWLLIAFGGLVFTTIIQSIWFAFRDKSVANFVMILFLVLNIACGFGTFPALIQFPLFNWLSYIMPFTYMMHAQGALIFNVAVGANALSASLYILQCVGILLIYPLIFYSLGLYNARRRSREIYYGSSIKKDVLDSLKRLGIEKRYLNKKGNLSWKKLPKKQMLEVIDLTLINHPYEKKFDWFKKRKRYIEEDLSKVSE